MPGIKIARGTDPFKKYWWVILVAFAAVGGWICLPVLDSPSTGSSSSGGGFQEGGLKTADQSLDSSDNPNGAQGSALDMPGAKAKAGGQSMASSLYQAPDGPVVAASTAIAPAGTTFADALKDITRASSAKAAVAASASKGGWTEAAQRGFTAPKANFGSMSGFGGGSGSSAGLSAAGGAAGSNSAGSFGSHGPNTGVSLASGLKGDDKGEPGSPKAVMHSLENARSASIAAAGAGSNDTARGSSGSSFDGNAGAAKVIGGGAAIAGTGGVYGSLDSAPMNLKANDPNLNQSKLTPPPTPVAMPAQQDQMKQFLMQIIMGIAMAGIMALV